MSAPTPWTTSAAARRADGRSGAPVTRPSAASTGLTFARTCSSAASASIDSAVRTRVAAAERPPESEL